MNFCSSISNAIWAPSDIELGRKSANVCPFVSPYVSTFTVRCTNPKKLGFTNPLIATTSCSKGPSIDGKGTSVC